MIPTLLIFDKWRKGRCTVPLNSFGYWTLNKYYYYYYYYLLLLLFIIIIIMPAVNVVYYSLDDFPSRVGLLINGYR